MRVTVPGVSRWESHAWSVCDKSGDTVQFLIAPVRGGYLFERWTDKVFALTKTEDQVKLSMQGPFGLPINFVKNINRERHNAYVFIVGGSGIAPALFAIRALLGDISLKGPTEDSNGLANTQPSIYLIWSMRGENAEKLSVIQPWLAPESPVHVHIYDTSRSGFDKGVIASANSTSIAPLMSRNRPSIRNLLYKIVESVGYESERMRPTVGLFVCGPESMTLDVLGDARVVEMDKNVLFDIEVESFEL
ncbi:hypothetical protein HDU93_003976 [Gonapodya sp. JEL0774]|nr:hypothetical protein HDU93_003976 [Gonapodya sp. JEL0774]